jgi:hypothetical protein
VSVRNQKKGTIAGHSFNIGPYIIFPVGSYFKTLSCSGGHLEFPIDEVKNTKTF